MAKKFMFVCIGILALTVAFLLGAQFGRAEYVDHSTTGIVSAWYDYVGNAYVLMDNGQVWDYTAVHVWQLDRQLPPFPIPVSQIKFWNYYFFVSENNDLWVQGRYTDWENVGSPPGGVATQASTWGSIKAQFKE